MIKKLREVMSLQMYSLSKIAPGRDFHVALIDGGHLPRRRDPHGHVDFVEFMYLVDGQLVHCINGDRQILSAGNLVFIRQADTHHLARLAARNLCFYNVAIRHEIWKSFVEIAKIETHTEEWGSATFPPVIELAVEDSNEIGRACTRILNAFLDDPKTSDAIRFLSVATDLISGRTAKEIRPVGLPDWLFHAMQLMKAGDHLVVGLSRFQELAGVSPEHLARTLRSTTGQSPTEFVNDLKLRSAARLLASSRKSIETIAAESGFQSVSYFHRAFRRRFGLPPHEFRKSCAALS